jgi:hypothetical protein
MHINPTTTPIDNFHNPTLLIKVVTACSPNSNYFAIRPQCRSAGTIYGSTGEQNQFYARARSAKKADFVPCILILPYAAGHCTPFSFIVVQECDAV